MPKATVPKIFCLKNALFRLLIATVIYFKMPQGSSVILKKIKVRLKIRRIGFAY